MAKGKALDYSSLFTLRKDGRYQAVVPGCGADGKAKYLYDRDPARLYAKVEAEKAPKLKTFGEIAEEWHDEHWEKIGTGTKRCYASHYNAILDEHKDTPFEAVGAPEIYADILKLKTRGMSAKSVSTRKSVYKLIFDYAIISGYTKLNPAQSVSVPSGLPKKERLAPEDDIIAIIIRSTNLPFGLFPFFLLFTGLRKGEALALQWRDINFDKKIISVTKSVEWINQRPFIKCPKTKAGTREVPLLGGLSALLKPGKPDEYIFGGTAGPMTFSAYRHAWYGYCKAAGLGETVAEPRTNKRGKLYTVNVFTPTLTAHQLRHGYATILYEADIDELTTQKIMGHADISTTHTIYVNLRDKHREAETKKIEEHFATNFNKFP
ncbi:MAG: site-specific integrase [Oscillospiraceae bacterium]